MIDAFKSFLTLVASSPPFLPPGFSSSSLLNVNYKISRLRKKKKLSIFSGYFVCIQKGKL